MSETKRDEKKTSKRNAAKLNAAIAGVLDSIRPPEDLTVVEWPRNTAAFLPRAVLRPAHGDATAHHTCVNRLRRSPTPKFGA